MIADPFPCNTSYRINVKRLRKVLTKYHISAYDGRHRRRADVAHVDVSGGAYQCALAKKRKKHNNLGIILQLR
jgi:hypothetical protein